MQLGQALSLLREYGVLLVAVIFFLEHLNCPGLPAGVIMPAVGMLAAQGGGNVTVFIVVSVLASEAGCLVTYGLFYWRGASILGRMKRRSEKMSGFIGRCTVMMEKHGLKGVFLCHLLPVLRTIVSIPAGIFRVKKVPFALYTLLGIIIWNTALILFGYFFRQAL